MFVHRSSPDSHQNVARKYRTFGEKIRLGGLLDVENRSLRGVNFDYEGLVITGLGVPSFLNLAMKLKLSHES
jgi:hypothetical protein